jgi:hypothetical protein
MSLAQGVLAALSLGDMDLLGRDLDWVRGLMHNFHYQMADETLHRYLRAYYEATLQELDHRGDPVKAWFADILQAEAQG